MLKRWKYERHVVAGMVSFQNEQLGWVKKDHLIQIFRFLAFLATDMACTCEAPNWIVRYIPGDVPSTDENLSFEDPGLASNSIHFSSRP